MTTVDPLARRLREHLVAGGADVVGGLGLERIAAGLSNETYVVDARIRPAGAEAATGPWAYRRPPQGLVLPSANDMAREFATLEYLARLGYPAPRPLMLFDPVSALGSSYVMTFEPGLSLATPADSAALDVAARARVSRSFAAALAALHALDVASYPRRSASATPFAARQLAVWTRQWAASSPSPADDARFQALGAALADWAASRTAGAPSVVHGDYRLDNVILTETQDVRAVLDWEMCTVGDRWCDLGLALVYWTEVGDDAARAATGIAEGVTQHAGFATRSELVEHYASSGATPPDDLDSYVALGFLKLAAIYQGIVARLRDHPQSGERFAALEDAIPRLLELGASSVARR